MARDKRSFKVYKLDGSLCVGARIEIDDHPLYERRYYALIEIEGGEEKISVKVDKDRTDDEWIIFVEV